MLKAAFTAATLSLAALALPGAASAAPSMAGAGLLNIVETPVEQVYHRGYRHGSRYYGRRPVRCRIVSERRIRPNGRVVIVRREICR